MKIATLSRHHHSDIPPVRVPARDEEEALAEAVELLTTEPLPRAQAEKIMGLLRAFEARKLGSQVDPGVAFEVEVSDVDSEAPYQVVAWYYTEGSPSKLNFGVGIGESVAETDRHENIWITIEEYVPDQERLAGLSSLSREELVERLLLLETISGRDSAYPR